MIDASAVQSLLMGSGTFIGTTMTGIGAYRLLNNASKKITRMPDTLEAGVRELSRTAAAIEQQSALLTQVVEIKGVIDAMRQDVSKVLGERTEISRELRIMARKIESFREAA
jgi:hypothetical protein